jgi:hypothetical protein
MMATFKFTYFCNPLFHWCPVATIYKTCFNIQYFSHGVHLYIPLVNSVLDLRVPQNAWKLSSGLTSGGFSSSSQFHRVSLSGKFRANSEIHDAYSLQIFIHSSLLISSTLFNKLRTSLYQKLGMVWRGSILFSLANVPSWELTRIE